jgi:hypothetical protein
MDVRRQLALVRRAEARQQKAVNWLLPGDPSPLETTIAYEPGGSRSNRLASSNRAGSLC